MVRMLWHFQRAFWTTAWQRGRGRSPRQHWSLPVDAATAFLALDGRYLMGLPVPRLRAEAELRQTPSALTAQVRVTPVLAGGVPAVWVEPRGQPPVRNLLYLHGGAYVYGSHVTHAEVLARLALTLQARVLMPSYRKAPEHPYPAALEDALSAWRFLTAGVAPSHLAVAGESAGGNLVLLLMMALRDLGEPLPAAAALVSAWADLSSSRPSVTANAALDWSDGDTLRRLAGLFTGAIPLTDPRVSPLWADLSGLPPLYLLVSRDELLCDENVELAERARAAGVTVALDLVSGVPHSPVFFAGWSPAARAGVGRMCAWLEERVAAG